MKKLLLRLVQPNVAWDSCPTLTSRCGAFASTSPLCGSHHHHSIPILSNVPHPAQRRCLATSVGVARAAPTPSRDLEAVRARRSELFDAEVERQRGMASERLEKIRIVVRNEDVESTDVEMWMNKDISTPRDCALHLKTNLVRRR